MRGRISGRLPVSVLSAAIILVMLTAGAMAEPVKVKSDDSFVVSGPVLSEPSTGRVPVGAGPAATRPAEVTAKNISLDFHAADIADVLKALSTQSSTNIVTSPDVKGQVTVALSKVTFEEAMDTITRMAGLKYTTTSPSTYVVGPPATVDAMKGVVPEPLVTETMTLAYASVDQLGKTLDSQVPGIKYTQTGSTTDKQSAKVLLLSGTKDQVQMAKTLVADVENRLAAEFADRQTEVIKLKYASAKDVTTALAAVLPNLSVTLGPTSGFKNRPPQYVTFVSTSSGASAGNAPADTPEEPSTIILGGSADDVTKARGIIAALDIRPKQVMIEAKVSDITLGAEKRLGISWSWTNVSFSEKTKDSGTGSGSFIRLPLDIDGQLDAMFKDNSAKLLANPTVAVLEGVSGTIFIGDEIKYIIRIEQTTTGVNFQTETASVGVTLRVIARPDSDGYITLALHPEVSTITDWLTVGTGSGGNNDKSAVALPQIARRYTDHVVRVKDGETIVIGGLIRDTEVNNMSKVPLLGDLPFFGSLFRHRQKSTEHSDIAIFLKAKVMQD